MTEVGTRRVTTTGVMHEMADRGVGTMCGRELAEPWTWTEEPTSCRHCLAAIERADNE